MISERVLLPPLPQLHLRAVEIAHHPGACGGHGDEHVVLAAVDLLAVVVVGMNRAGKNLVRPAVHRRRIDAERAVRQPLGKLGAGLAALVYRREVWQWLAVVVELSLLLGRCARDPVRTGKQPVEVIEAAVLRVDDDDMLDACEALRCWALRRRSATGEERRSRRQNQFDVHSALAFYDGRFEKRNPSEEG